MKETICLTAENVTVCGRHTYNKSGALLLTWPLSGFMMNFKGERAIIHFTDNNFDGPTLPNDIHPIYVSVEIDGRRQRFAVGRVDEKILLDDLGAGEHTLVLHRVSEGDIPIAVACVEVFGDMCGVLTPPKLPELRMEFIGDSITCGFGILGSADSVKYESFEEDAGITYAALTAKAFDADIRATAKGGHGIVCDYNGEYKYLIPEFFERVHSVKSENHDFSSWIPHVAVINGGTNDSGGKLDAKTFIDGAAAFIDRVREVYPDAYIVWAYGMMGSDYEEVLDKYIAERKADGDKVYYVSLPYTGDDGKGAGAHPNVIAHKRAARVLTDALHEILHI